MIHLLRSERRVLAVYTLLGAALWAVPVLNILHVESAAVVATVAFFTAGVAAVRRFEAGLPFGRVLGAQLAALVAPWAMLTVTLAWVPNCGYAQGMMFFLLFPVVTVVWAVALAYALPGRSRVLVAVGLGVALLAPLYDLGLHPQFYVYNHVFGGVLGPIYDEELAIRPGLFAFRALTLLWALLCYLVGRKRRGHRTPGGVRSGFDYPLVFPLTFAAIGLCYVFAAQLGFNSPGWYIERQLGAVHRTAHFDLYYDPASLTEDELARLAADHEYRYAQLAAELDDEGPGRVASYLYPDADTKARLTGARLTNVAPVWLRRAQVHVLLSSYASVFPHELAHAFSRAFGLPVLKASLSVGLVEGWAVALEPPDGLPTPHEQVAAAAFARAGPGNPLDLARNLSGRLSPLGFWTSRGAVSYTTMGSFVRFLIDAYGVERLKKVYKRGDFEAVYGKPAAALAEEWERHLAQLPVVARAAAPLVRRRFSVPSLFERRCPHYVPRYERHYRAGVQALARGDTARASASYEAALAIWPSYPTALDAWARLRLAQGDPGAVVARLDTLDAGHRSTSLSLRLADALAVLGRVRAAREQYEAAYAALPLYARESAAWLTLRAMLADLPEAVRVLASGMAPEEQARRLSTLRDGRPAVGLLRAFLLAQGGQYEQAVALLRTTPLPEDAALPLGRSLALERQRRVWLAEFAYRAGAFPAAEAYARQAARAYRNAGDFNAVAWMDDFATQMQALQNPSGPVLAGAASD